MEWIWVNLVFCGFGWGEVEFVYVVVMLEVSVDGDKIGMVGDVDIFVVLRGNWVVEYVVIQVEGVCIVFFVGVMVVDDDRIFGRMCWVNGSLDGDDMLVLDVEIMLFECNFVVGVECVVFFYLCEFEWDLVFDYFVRSYLIYSYYFVFVCYMNGFQNQGCYKYVCKEWVSDILEDVFVVMEFFKDCIDICIIYKVGEIMFFIFDNMVFVVLE